ncbi:MAG: hypothetical protein U9O24_02500 [Campylobacterota bacterium]|nr:hypothetical protein [Campylobacterota bacterium]
MKKIWFSFIVLLSMSMLQAQEFHPYKVKSGKITYEKRKYSMHAKLHIDSNGKASGSRSNPSYVEEEVTYYWDNYGNVAYEVGYQVSKFGGKPLPKKVKKYERLWKDNHRYYYNVKKNKVSDDPHRIRQKCLASKAYKDSGWLAVMYPHASIVVNESVAGKMVKHYKESESWDFYEWNGVILRDVSYSTKKKNGKYKRFEPNREKVAIKVEADIKVDASVFSPKWLKK